MISEIERLKDLDFNKQIVFAYLTCERLYPNYVYFSRNYNFGNPDSLRKAIDFLFSNLFEQTFENTKLFFLRKEVYDNTPDPGEFKTGLASAALDACTAVIESLTFLSDKKFSRLKDILTFATDTVHMYIQYIEKMDFNTDKDFDQKIKNHPLMKKELAIQSEIVDMLSNSSKIDSKGLEYLLHIQNSNIKGSLDL